jgi:thioredoxin reductase
MPDYSRKFFPHCDEFLEYIDAFEAYHNVQVQYNTKVTEISKPDGPNGKSFTINTMPTTPPEDCKADDDQQCIPEHADTTEYHCGNVVVATSLGRPHIPNVPGIELTEGYETLSNDADDFHNQTVMILGLGNSAFETGEFISQEGGAYVHMIGRNKGGLRLAYATHYVGDLRAVNVHITDTFLLKSLDTIDVGFDLEKGEFTKNEETGKIHLNFPHQKDINYNYREGYGHVIRALG